MDSVVIEGTGGRMWVESKHSCTSFTYTLLVNYYLGSD